MSARRKNLLEAFRSADSAASTPPSGAEAPPRSPAPHRAPRELPRLPGWLPWAVGVSLAFAVGFAFGRRSGGEARAEEPAPSGDPRAREPAARTAPRDGTAHGEPGAKPGARPADPASGASKPSSNIEESPLFDAKNRYTVVVATYSRSNQDLAWAAYEHLRDEQIPVFLPVSAGDLLLVLAGAAPTSAELESLEARIEAIRKDGGWPYDDAYRQGIDKLISRTNKKGN